MVLAPWALPRNKVIFSQKNFSKNIWTWQPDGWKNLAQIISSGTRPIYLETSITARKRFHSDPKKKLDSVTKCSFNSAITSTATVRGHSISFRLCFGSVDKYWIICVHIPVPTLTLMMIYSKCAAHKIKYFHCFAEDYFKCLMINIW